jgi:AraC-like DNA-binding protein
MEYACRRLRRGDCDMPELARRLGFSDIANFYHAFRRWTGCAPGAYRKNQVRRR